MGVKLNLSLDTHIWLWWLAESPRMGKEIKALISNPKTAVFVSAISIWEVTVKKQIGKLNIEGDLLIASSESDIELLPFTPLNALTVRDLPLHHRDPFDRALLAQAKSEQMTLITADRKLLDYSQVVNLRFVE